MFHGILGDPSKTEEERKENISKAAKVMHDEKNPCIKEYKLSLKCLDENNFNRGICVDYFENYKKCKEFWEDIRIQRRKAGIVPNLPTATERQQIKMEYMEKLRTGRQT